MYTYRCFIIQAFYLPYRIANESFSSESFANEEGVATAMTSSVTETPGSVTSSRVNSLTSQGDEEDDEDDADAGPEVVVRVVRPSRSAVHMSPSCYRTTFGCGAKDFITETVSRLRLISPVTFVVDYVIDVVNYN